MSTRPLFAATRPSSLTTASPLHAIIFMKIGYHADEDLAQILARKKREEEECGVIFWGYGGNACHPTNQVLPFVSHAIAAQQRPVLAMKVTQSRFSGECRFATEFSVDGVDWNPLPPGAIVKGSRYALICRNIQQVDAQLNLAEYTVAIGPSVGKQLNSYLRYRVDKACAWFTGDSSSDDGLHTADISYVADLVEPYAVFVR